MSASLVSDLMMDFRGGPVNRIAAVLGESPAKIQTAMSGVLSALTGTLAGKTSTKAGANDLLDLIHRNGLDTGSYADVSGATTAPDGVTRLIHTGEPLLETVLGERSNSIADWVSSVGTIPRAAATSLLSLALPLVLGAVGRRVLNSGWNTGSLMSLMAGQSFLQDAPPGLAAALGTSGPSTAGWPVAGSYETDIRREGSTPRPVVGVYRSDSRSRSSFWRWALPLLLLGLLGYFLTQRSTPPPQTAATLSRADVLSVPAPPPPPSLGPFVDRTLRNAVILNVPADGVESKLIAFIEDPTRVVDKETWFSLDRIEFDTGTATVRPSSREQLNNIAQILRAYPEVSIKIGGYTDNVGDDASNLKLSADRAANTTNEIAALGIDSSRLAAEGYGRDFPVADNSTEEGRQRNRRIDIRVTRK